MPIAAIGIGLGSAIAGGAAAGATVYGASRSAHAATQAGDIQAQTAARALAYQREQDARQLAQYNQEYADKMAAQKLEQDRQAALDARQAALDAANLGLATKNQDWTFQQRADKLDRLAPYRDFGQQGMNKLSGLL